MPSPKNPSPLDDKSFLRLSAIQRTLAPQSQELDQLDKRVSKLERSQRWRSSSGVDLEPYSHLLRAHLQNLRSSRSTAKPDGAFLRSAIHLVRLLESLTARQPAVVTAKTG